jgi:hypothetical protein
MIVRNRLNNKIWTPLFKKEVVENEDTVTTTLESHTIKIVDNTETVEPEVTPEPKKTKSTKKQASDNTDVE